MAVAVGLSWFLVVSTAPGREQPWAYGSHDGTAISAAFAYDGLDRLAGPERGGAARSDARCGAGGECGARRGGERVAAAGGRLRRAPLRRAAGPPGGSSPTRADLRGLLGVELLPALVVGLFAVAFGWRARPAGAGRGAVRRRVACSPGSSCCRRCPT